MRDDTDRDEALVEVVFASLDVPETRRAALAASLNAEERVRASRRANPLLRARFEVGRGLLRERLGSLLGCPPSEVALRTGRHGKPALADPLAAGDLRFNLAHSADRLVVAVVRGHEVGVDIEKRRAVRHGDRVARRVFSDEELASLSSLRGDAWRDAFFRGWTRKEAVSKAIGAGLGFPFRRMTVTLCRDEAARLVRIEDDAAASARWSLVALDAGPGFEAALAVEGTGARVVVVPFPVVDRER